MRRSLRLLFLGVFVFFIGTGLYTLFPSSSYILIAGVCAYLYHDKQLRKNPLKYIDLNMLRGLFLFNIFLLIQMFFSQIGSQSYYNQMTAMCVMILTFTFVQLVLDKDQVAYKIDNRTFNFILLIGLFLILIGQVAQIKGYIKQINFEGADGDLIITVARPGGFLNPNVTAAIAMIFIFMMHRLSEVIGKYIFVVALPTAMTVILLTQSRTALIALLVFLVFIVTKNSLRQMVLPLLVVFVLFFFVRLTYPDVVASLIDNVLQRFEGDESSDERQDLLRYSFEAFLNSPFFGNGSTYLVGKLGVSSHNQIVEMLVSYGLFGFLVAAIVFVLIYLPCSSLLIVFCIIPILIFTHNFFDSLPYQVVLAIALALDRNFRSSVTVERSF